MACHKNIDIEEIIKLSGLNKTKSLTGLLHVLTKAHEPLSAAQILDQLHDKGLKINEATVFRIIKKLKLEEIIDELSFNEGFNRYEIKEHGHHHHYIKCHQCENLEAFHFCEMGGFYNRLKKMGYQDITHKLEFSGLCGNCR